MIEIRYLREIGARLDSGMTLQVANDYGHLARLGHRVVLPVAYAHDEDLAALRAYLAVRGGDRVELVARDIRRGPWQSPRLRRAALIADLLRRPGAAAYVVREHKNVWPGRLLRRRSGGLLIGELHESGFLFDRPARAPAAFARWAAALDGVLFTTGAQIEFLRARGAPIPERHVVLPNGIDAGALAAVAAGEGPPWVITYSGQFTTWKNLPLLFAALARLPAGYRLRLAGGKLGGGDSAALVAELVRAHGVAGRVDYLGFVHPDAVAREVIAGSSVLAVPLGDAPVARYATSPMKLVEYLSTPIPVVAVDHPSVRALAGPDTAHLAAMDAGAFARAIEAAVHEPAAARAARLARARARAAGYDHAVRAARFSAWLAGLSAPRA